MPWPSAAAADLGTIYLESVCGVVDGTIGARGATIPTKTRTPGRLPK